METTLSNNDLCAVLSNVRMARAETVLLHAKLLATASFMEARGVNGYLRRNADLTLLIAIKRLASNLLDAEKECADIFEAAELRLDS